MSRVVPPGSVSQVPLFCAIGVASVQLGMSFSMSLNRLYAIYTDDPKHLKKDRVMCLHRAQKNDTEYSGSVQTKKHLFFVFFFAEFTYLYLCFFFRLFFVSLCVSMCVCILCFVRVNNFVVWCCLEFI